MYHIFLIQIAFQSSDRVKLDFWGSAIKIALNFTPEGLKKSNFLPKGSTTFQNFGNETLIIAKYKYVEKIQFCCVGYKVMAKRWQHFVSILSLRLNKFEWIKGDLCLHCIADVRAYCVETKPSEIDNPWHQYQIAWQRCLCLCSRGGKIF